MFIEKITAKENLFLKRLTELMGGGIPVYIWGALAGGENVKDYLGKNGIAYDGVVVNRRFYDPSMKDVICLEDLLENTKTRIGLIVAFKGYDEKILENYKDKVEVLEYDCYSGLERLLNFEWVMQNRDLLQSTYDCLEDDLSRDSLIAFLNQKISCNFGYLPKIKKENQYFEDGLMALSDNEVLVDCGAYTGDSAVSFVEALHRQGINNYKEIISFEPDEDNYNKLLNRNFPNHTCIKKGCSDHSGKVVFSGNSSEGRIVEDEENGYAIFVDTIDSVAKDKNVTIIKMDIEGSELAALKGAEETIKRCHPRLAICIYHKKEDLYEIPRYIKSLSEDYKYYIRAYDDNAIELVLYAL